MKAKVFPDVFPEGSRKKLLQIAAKVAPQSLKTGSWTSGSPAFEVFNICTKHLELLPLPRRAVVSLDQYVSAWIQSFEEGFKNRASKRPGKPVATMADPMVDIILEAGLKKSPTEVAQVVTDHRLGMAAENILGSLLEEYISIHVQDHGWYCCWGNTVRHVDFCSKVGGLLQIKNRSNSENSSSNKVRAGTDIVRWFRIDAASGETYWERLCQISGSQDLSEVGFKTFIQNTLKTNPGLLPA